MEKARRPRHNVVTIEDVAKLAGVSPSTASRVIGATHPVREANRSKVMEAARTLNYVPNLAARSLASGATERIGVICSNPSAAYLSAFLLGAMERSANRGAELLLFHCPPGDEQSERAALSRLSGSTVSGVLLPSPRNEGALVPQLLKEMNVRTVTVGDGKAADFSCVHIDDRAATREMTEYLLRLGHRRIGFITGHPSHQSSRVRMIAFLEAMGEQADSMPLIAQGYFTFDSGLAAAEQLIKSADRPTAIFASNDDMAAAVISVAQRLGLSVPRDLTVVGYDDTDLAVTLWPPLTTIRQPVTEMAAVAVDLLLQEVRSARRGTPAESFDLVMQHQLVERLSAAPPPSKPAVALSDSAYSAPLGGLGAS